MIETVFLAQVSASTEMAWIVSAVVKNFVNNAQAVVKGFQSKCRSKTDF